MVPEAAEIPEGLEYYVDSKSFGLRVRRLGVSFTSVSGCDILIPHRGRS